MAAQKKAKKTAKKTSAKKLATEGNAAVLKLDKQCNIQSVADLKQQLAAALVPGEKVSIDAGEVESVDTAALQLLVAFKLHSEAKSSPVSWVETSAAFADSARLLDLDQHLGLGADAA